MNPRKYATPLAFKSAVEHRLRNDAEATGIDLQRRRQLLVFDRFLARLFQIFENAVVLKGAMALELRLNRVRTTRDVDLGMTGSPGDVIARLQEAGRLDLCDFLRFEVAADPKHPIIEAEGMAYQGLRYKAEARLGAKIYGAPFGIDVAFAEPMTCSPDEVDGSSFLDFAGVKPGRYRIYPLETHVSEKLHAYTLPRKRPNSRVKDLPDIALLASVRDIDGATLRAAIDRTFDHRATHSVPMCIPDPPTSWACLYKRMADEHGLEWRTLDEVTDAVRSFLNPVLAGNPARWYAGSWSWLETRSTEP